MSKRRVLDGVSALPATIRGDAVFIGNVEGQENFVVHGQVRGDSDVHGVLMLGPSCDWHGNIVANVVVVKGRVTGNITARSKVELRATARVKGDLRSPLIAVAEGAVVQGRVSRDSIITRFQERRTH